MRRDLTINALFYNLNERTVEDMTGKVRAPLQRCAHRVPQPGSAPDPGRAFQGLEDLRSGLARTPMDPHTTLLDDPLRVLR